MKSEKEEEVKRETRKVNKGQKEKRQKPTNMFKVIVKKCINEDIHSVQEKPINWNMSFLIMHDMTS